MNAVSLYVTASRLIFSSLNLDDSGKWSDVNRLIVFLRQSLTCCVCGNLLVIPMTSAISSCQHHVCKGCMGGKMRLKPSCSNCKDQSKFTENIQLRTLLQCYKKLCSYVNSTDIPNKWGSMTVSCANGPTPAAVSASASHGVGALISGPTTFYQLIEEGSNLSDKFSYSTSSVPASSSSACMNATQSSCLKTKFPATAPSPLLVTKAKVHQTQNTPPASSSEPVPSAPVGPLVPVSKRCLSSSEHEPESPLMKRVKTEESISLTTSSSPAETAEKIVKHSEESTISISVKEMTSKPTAITTLPTVNCGMIPVVSLPNVSAPQIMITTVPDMNQKNVPAVEVIDMKGPLAVTSCPVVDGKAASISTSTTSSAQGQQSIPSLTLSVSSTGSGNGSKKPGKRRGCRCGLATPNPGKLTCCGQRCPCYVDGKGCFDCKCRGCRNPHKANTNSGIPVTPAVKPAVKANPNLTNTITTASPASISSSSSTAGKISVFTSGTVTGISANAALVNTLQSNGVSCQLVTVGAAAAAANQQSSQHLKSHQQVNLPKTTTITLTSGNNHNLFLSPSICLINAPASTATASAGASSTQHSDHHLNSNSCNKSLPVSLTEAASDHFPAGKSQHHPMILDD